MSQQSLAPTDKEKILEDFKKELEADGFYKKDVHDDYVLTRFLRARKYDLPKSKAMFEACEKWREDFKVEEIVESFSFPESAEVRVLYPRFYHKTDKKGRPVYYELLGALDVKKLWAVTNTERMIMAYVREYEKLLRYRFAAASIKAGTRIEQGCTILDLKGVSLSQFNSVRKIVAQVTSIAQNYYPETLGRMFIINAPALFTTVWAIVKPMLDEATVQKISVLGSGYKKALLEEIDAENLPVSYGGTCDSCLGGCEFADVGPWNDGTVPGFPNDHWENMKLRDVKKV
ncbi:cytosolic factor, phosphatidylinositol/phosphatidylcholine transfer protein [Dinochytrium kinnereticum]|nr:cytosolic factor, phosphatidylinositol/phosphatidylcholine transfer protein [Dinochytrium kinnereticum]